MISKKLSTTVPYISSIIQSTYAKSYNIIEDQVYGIIKVPQKWLIPQLLASDSISFPEFKETGNIRGLDHIGLAGGSILEDFDNDNDIHQLNGSKYRDDGPNDIDSDIDGDGLENNIDWDDDNDGINDLYDPDDGNCGVVDTDINDQFYQPYYPVSDGDSLDGSNDAQEYTADVASHWNMSYLMNPFTVTQNFVLDYNGYDGTTSPVTSGNVPEFYWFLLSRWSPWNGGNEADIDADGDNLGAEAHFNNVMINKVGNALERKREELAKTFVRDAQVVKDEED